MKKLFIFLVLLCLLPLQVKGYANKPLIDIMKESAISDSDVDFTHPTTGTGVGGIYYVAGTEDSENPIYYYRGDVKNYAIYAGKCWNIMRTAENSGVKLLYAGLPTNDKCLATETGLWIDTNAVSYNDNNDELYVGYTYGEENTDSKLKEATDTWFQNNMLDYINDLEDVSYCNDREKSTISTNYFTSNDRINVDDGHVVTPSYNCRTEDKYTVGDIGNGLLKYPVGNISADEIIYAGGAYTNKYGESNSYALTYKYWSMTPHNGGSSSKMLYPNSLKYLNRNNVTYQTGVRPIIAVKKDAYTNTGDGTRENPYRITVPVLYNVEVKENGNGTATISKAVAEENDVITVKIDNIAAGYAVDKIIFYDKDDNVISVNYSKDNVTTYKFKMPAQDIKVEITYKPAIDNPNTLDNITKYVIIGGVGVVLIVVCIIIIKKKKKQ